MVKEKIRLVDCICGMNHRCPFLYASIPLTTGRTLISCASSSLVVRLRLILLGMGEAATDILMVLYRFSRQEIAVVVVK